MTAPPFREVARVEVEPGLSLRAEIWGPLQRDGDPPLVLVHGFMGSAPAWGELPSRLASIRPVVVPELPGHGGSDRPGDPEVYRVPRVAAMLGRLAATLDLGAADWLGYSMGGRIVLAGVAEGHLTPRRVILESASPGLADPGEAARRRMVDEERAVALEADGIRTFVDAWLDLPLFATQRRLPDPVRARERLRRLDADPVALAACLRGGGTGSQPSYWDALPAMERPALLLTGALDGKFGALARRMGEALPRARQVALAGVGHAVHLEHPEGWRAAVEDFLVGPD